jgi:hypothetical protein
LNFSYLDWQGFPKVTESDISDRFTIAEATVRLSELFSASGWMQMVQGLLAWLLKIRRPILLTHSDIQESIWQLALPNLQLFQREMICHF